MPDELIIDEKNFHEYFHDVRTNKPQRGQVLARYCAWAELVDGKLKRDIIEFLRFQDAKGVPKIMRKMVNATEEDSLRVPKEMLRDLLSGMTVEQVARKEYKFLLEVFFYTKKEYVPKDDPHWSLISLVNLDKFMDDAELDLGKIDKTESKDGLTITTKEVGNEVSLTGPQPGNGQSVETALEGPQGCGDQSG